MDEELTDQGKHTHTGETKMGKEALGEDIKTFFKTETKEVAKRDIYIHESGMSQPLPADETTFYQSHILRRDYESIPYLTDV